MKSFLRELLIDLKAAVLIADPDSLAAAIDRIREAEDDDLPPIALLPLGEALSPLPAGALLALLEEADPALRGAAAAAAALRAHKAGDIPGEALLYAADEPVPELRQVFAQALSREPETAGKFIESWLTSESTYVQQTALEILACLGQVTADGLALLALLDRAPEHDFRSTLVEALNALAEGGMQDQVFSLLENWAGRPEPNVWVITRSLSASWAQSHSPIALAILDRLAETAGEIRPILRARERHLSEDSPE